MSRAFELLPAIIIIEDRVELIDIKGVDARIELNRAAVIADLLLLEIPTFSGKEFKKTSYEKDLLKRCKIRWRNDMKASVLGWTRKSDYYLERRTL